MKKLRKISDIFFHPFLWCIPFMILLVLNVPAFLKDGFYAFQPVISYKEFSSGSMIIFSLLGIFSLIFFSRSKLKRELCVIFTFIVLFSCYGTGEIASRFIRMEVLFGYNPFEAGVLTYLFVSVYPMFFFFQNILLYHFYLKDRDPNYKLFFKMIILQWTLYAISIYLFWYHKGEIISYQRGIYQISRLVGTLAYAVLIASNRRLK